jgi:Cd2+/Zn2+-exporting ATPase
MEAAIRKEYILDGLCCPMCAEKMQKRIQKLNGVESASIDFATQKLLMTLSGAAELSEIVAKASRIVKQYEPEIVISEFGVERKRVQKQEAIDRRTVLNYARLGVAVVLFTAPRVVSAEGLLRLALFLAAYLIVGGDVLWRAVRNITKGQVFDENFLMSVATIGAFAVGEYPEGVAVMLFYQVGEAFQRVAVGRSRKSITALMDIRPDYANLKVGEKLKRVVPQEINTGDLIVVRPGEKIPLDGVVTEGSSTLDTSALTGESLPRDVHPGDQALSGSVNKSGLITIEVQKAFGESTVSKILELVQNASAKKSKVENFITKFARYYTPAVVGAAVLLAVLPPLVLPGARFDQWLSRALVFLVVSCPCALVISIPLSFFGGIGGASRNGILVKGSNYLEALTNVETVIFDKTGTLTNGEFSVTKIEPASGFSPGDLLRYAAFAESASTHPIAASIRKTYGKPVNIISGIEEMPGFGVKAVVDGKTILAGNAGLLDRIDLPLSDAFGTVVYVAVNGVYAGRLVIADTVKPDSKQAVAQLKRSGVKQIIMFTGDNKNTAQTIFDELALDGYRAELLPHQKVEELEQLQVGGRGKLVFVGDGINDAPVLARADVGIAMGGLGSDAAIEAADVVLMTDEPSKVAAAIQIARKTKSIVWQNVVFALGVKGSVLVLGSLGIATMWAAVFGDVGVAIIAILNASRVLNVKNIA